MARRMAPTISCRAAPRQRVRGVMTQPCVSGGPPVLTFPTVVLDLPQVRNRIEGKECRPPH
jgi:hypothetical protein